MITFGVATVAERFTSISGSIQVTSVTTTNSVYWVITFTVMAWVLVAAFAHATAERGAPGELARHLYSRRWTSAVARWVAYGFGAATCSGVLVAVVMMTLPAFFPTAYSGVDLTSAEGGASFWQFPPSRCWPWGSGSGWPVSSPIPLGPS